MGQACELEEEKVSNATVTRVLFAIKTTSFDVGVLQRRGSHTGWSRGSLVAAEVCPGIAEKHFVEQVVCTGKFGRDQDLSEKCPGIARWCSGVIEECGSGIPSNTWCAGFSGLRRGYGAAGSGRRVAHVGWALVNWAGLRIWAWAGSDFFVLFFYFNQIKSF